jgi:hypothetical protein
MGVVVGVIVALEPQLFKIPISGPAVLLGDEGEHPVLLQEWQATLKALLRDGDKTGSGSCDGGPKATLWPQLQQCSHYNRKTGSRGLNHQDVCEMEEFSSSALHKENS